MASDFKTNEWAVILGGSSGFGLATAHELAAHGMNLAIVHRDRRGAMGRIEEEFEHIRATEVRLVTFNSDALSPGVRDDILDSLSDKLGDQGRIRFLLHSIAFGNLKLVVHEARRRPESLAVLATELKIDADTLQAAVDHVFDDGADGLAGIASPPEYSESLFLDEEDMARTVHAMGTSLLGWVQAIHRRDLFAADARVFGLTSEGNTVAWKGYAAVAAAKVALESIARSIAVEFAPYGIRCNVIQAGVTDTPALRMIPGNRHLMAEARSRNPMGRLTRPEDVARVLCLLARDEAGWVNGEVIRVDGGEHISGVRR